MLYRIAETTTTPPPSDPPPKIVVVPPAVFTGSYLAQNRLPPPARVHLALRLLHGNARLEKLTITQIARLCRVSRQRIYASGESGRGSNGTSLVRAFRRATPEQRIAIVKAIGVEEIWQTLTAAL